MDYKTKPLSRMDIRKLAKIFRKAFHASPIGPFPVLLALERLPDLFPGSNYVIVEDDYLDATVPCRCIPNDNAPDSFTIEIKESVYNGAYNGVGAYRDHICHELCHLFLFHLGYRPVVERCYREGELKKYESVEWQAKALCGEVMLPFKETQGFENPEDLAEIYGIKVIPNVRLGDNRTIGMLDAIPHGCLVAVGTNGFMKELSIRQIFTDQVSIMVDVLRPKGILVYGQAYPSVFKSDTKSEGGA